MVKYIITEYTDGEETGQMTYKDRRTAEYIGQLKEKANPNKSYRLHVEKDTPLIMR